MHCFEAEIESSNGKLLKLVSVVFLLPRRTMNINGDVFLRFCELNGAVAVLFGFLSSAHTTRLCLSMHVCFTFDGQMFPVTQCCAKTGTVSKCRVIVKPSRIWHFRFRMFKVGQDNKNYCAI